MSPQANAPTPTRSEIEAAVIARAQANPEFRQSLLKNANAAIEKEFGVSLPNDTKLIAVEETATTHYLLLPPTDDGELSEADLAAVAGGNCVDQSRGQTSSNLLKKISDTAPGITANMK